MQVDNKILDDLARVASGAFGALTGLRGEIEARLREQFERILSQMDVVSREEFEAVRAIATKARAEQEAAADRIAELEQAVFGKTRRPDPGAALAARDVITPPET